MEDSRISSARSSSPIRGSRPAPARRRSIQELNGQLLIYNTSDAHRQVVDLLDQLRKTQALQISVETRFLDVTAQLPRAVRRRPRLRLQRGHRRLRPQGAQGDLVDPFTGAPVLIPRQYSRIGSIPQRRRAWANPFAGRSPAQPYGQPAWYRPRAVVPRSSEHDADLGPAGLDWTRGSDTINTGVRGSFASQQSGLQPALNIAGSFLDNLQVDFLIRATQANRGRALCRPRGRAVQRPGGRDLGSVARGRMSRASSRVLARRRVGFQPVTAQTPTAV
jgi:hypothetical protein